MLAPRLLQSACHPDAVPTASAATPIDHAHLQRFTQNDAALEREVLGLFAEQLPALLLHLMAAQTERAWFEAAHALKGSARAVGAWQIASLAERAEVAGCFGNAEAREATIDALAAALGEARCYISELTAPAPG